MTSVVSVSSPSSEATSFSVAGGGANAGTRDFPASRGMLAPANPHSPGTSQPNAATQLCDILLRAPNLLGSTVDMSDEVARCFKPLWHLDQPCQKGRSKEDELPTLLPGQQGHGPRVRANMQRSRSRATARVAKELLGLLNKGH